MKLYEFVNYMIDPVHGKERRAYMSVCPTELFEFADLSPDMQKAMYSLERVTIVDAVENQLKELTGNDLNIWKTRFLTFSLPSDEDPPFPQTSPCYSGVPGGGGGQAAPGAIKVLWADPHTSLRGIVPKVVTGVNKEHEFVIFGQGIFVKHSKTGPQIVGPIHVESVRQGGGGGTVTWKVIGYEGTLRCAALRVAATFRQKGKYDVTLKNCAFLKDGTVDSTKSSPVDPGNSLTLEVQ